MTDDDKSKAIAEYTKMAKAYANKRFDTEEEKQVSLKAVQAAKKELMKNLEVEECRNE